MVRDEDAYNVLRCYFTRRITAVDCQVKYLSCWFATSVWQRGFRCTASHTVNYVRHQCDYYDYDDDISIIIYKSTVSIPHFSFIYRVTQNKPGYSTVNRVYENLRKIRFFTRIAHRRDKQEEKITVYLNIIYYQTFRSCPESNSLLTG